MKTSVLIWTKYIRSLNITWWFLCKLEIISKYKGFIKVRGRNLLGGENSECQGAKVEKGGRDRRAGWLSTGRAGCTVHQIRRQMCAGALSYRPKALGFIIEERRSPENFITWSDLCFKIILCVSSINWIVQGSGGGKRMWRAGVRGEGLWEMIIA